jgi:hypothetical protein
MAEIEVVELVKGDERVVVNKDSAQEKEFRNAGYRKAPEPRPAKESIAERAPEVEEAKVDDSNGNTFV